MPKILLAEDDDGISGFVVPELQHEGFLTCLAKTGREALELFAQERPDLVLLDIMLPELNGLEVLRRLRKTSDVPVILATARGETIDKINGLNSGADDYIAKPFDIEELLARINAVLRRTQKKNAPERLMVQELELQTGNMSVRVNGNPLVLSKTEFLMLKFFMENKDTVLSRSDIIDSVWGEHHFIDENTIDVYVGYLRTKIGEFTDAEYIKTVRGSGYLLTEPGGGA